MQTMSIAEIGNLSADERAGMFDDNDIIREELAVQDHYRGLAQQANSERKAADRRISEAFASITDYPKFKQAFGAPLTAEELDKIYDAEWEAMQREED